LRFNGGNQNKGTPFPIILEIGIVCYSEWSLLFTIDWI
jgi:hypothetical protein